MQSLHGAVQAVEQAHIVLVQIVGSRPCPLLAMQIGLAVMLGKRIVVMVEGDAEVPELLKKVAFHVGRAGRNPRGDARGHQAGVREGRGSGRGGPKGAAETCGA